MVIWQVVIEVLASIGLITLGIYKGVKASKRGQNGKAVGWFVATPVLGLIGLFSLVILALAAAVAICLFVLGMLSGSLDHGMIRHSIKRAEFRSDVQTGVTRALDGTGPTTFHARSAWDGRGGWIERAESASDAQSATSRAMADWLDHN